MSVSIKGELTKNEYSVVICALQNSPLMPTEQFHLHCINAFPCLVETEPQNRADKFNMDLLNTIKLGPLEN